MTYKTIQKACLVAGLALSASSVALAADAPALLTGASAGMLSNTCAGCHGSNGASTGPATPTIAGLSKDYFIEAMQGFKSGEVPSTIMSRIAKGYSDVEFKQMAEWFAGKPFVKAKQDFNPALAKQGAKLHDKYCEKCHGEGGQSAEDDAGVMAGQWTPYLEWTLADYLAGDRAMTKKMKKKMKKMLSKEGDAGTTALLNYYASQQ